MVEKVIGTIQSNLKYPVTVEYTKGTPGDQFGIYGNNNKIYSQLGWSPKIDFDEGMKKMIEWALNN